MFRNAGPIATTLVMLMIIGVPSAWAHDYKTRFLMETDPDNVFHQLHVNHHTYGIRMELCVESSGFSNDEVQVSIEGAPTGISLSTDNHPNERCGVFKLEGGEQLGAKVIHGISHPQVVVVKFRPSQIVWP